MRIKWLGHASFLVTCEDGTKIITDPYDEKFGGLGYERIQETADIVLMSHQHGDHAGKVNGNPQVITKAGITEAKGIEFKGIASYHDQSGGKERGPNTIFCFTVDSIRVCHLGDLGHLLSDEQISEIGDVDILLIPVGGFFTIGPEEATKVVDQLKPKVVIPMHFKTDKCDFPISGAEEFLKGKTDVERFKGSEKEFKKEELPAQVEFILLEHAC